MQQPKPAFPAVAVVAIVAVLVVIAVGALFVGQFIGGHPGQTAAPSGGIALGSGSPQATASLGEPDGSQVPGSSTGPRRTPGGSTAPGTTPRPTEVGETPGPSLAPGTSFFPGGLLIADEDNDRLIVVNDAGEIIWRFPVAGSLAPGVVFSADDAFLSPDHKTIVANEETKQVIVRIDIATEKIIWEYGKFNNPGRGPGQLWNPDDAYPLANGDIIVADILNCRILQIAQDKHIVHQWGRTGHCGHNPPKTYAQPNGDTPLPDGGMLITEILAKRVVRLSPTGQVIFDIHVPLHYPSDAQLLPDGNVLVVDYWSPGTLLVINPTTGKVVFRYSPKSGEGMLDHTSLALPLANGMFVLNDDRRHRVVVIDPVSNRIVWQYGHTDVAGTAKGYLNNPDGVDVLPVGVFN